jgi:hypothetical protein
MMDDLCANRQSTLRDPANQAVFFHSSMGQSHHGQKANHKIITCLSLDRNAEPE